MLFRSDYKQSGVMQGLSYRTRNNDLISATGWWQYDHRSLPQGIYIDNIPVEKNKTNNIRTMVSYDGARDNSTFNASVAYFYSTMDYTRYFGEELTNASTNVNNSFVTKGEYTYLGIKKLMLTGILSYRMDQVKSDNYENTTQVRNTINATAVASYRITPRLHVDARVPFEWSEQKAFARYNVSGRYRIIDQWLTVKATNG